ncbi:MAG: hypothetical protein ACHQ4H_17175 [Ktedonobacterales bacterium]
MSFTTDAAADVRTAQQYATLLGFGAGMFALLQALIAASTAAASQASVLAYQHSLITDSAGGGVSIEPLIGPLVQLFAITYLTNLLSFAITLGFCWYAARIVVLLTGDQQRARNAALRVVAISTAVWLAVTLIAALLFRADGTIAWLVATALKLLGSGPTSGVLVTQPDGAFLAAQAALLLLQAAAGFAAAVVLAALAGRRGGESVRSVREAPPA